MTTQSDAILEEVTRLHNHQQEIKKLKGEHFNIFSILQMEYKENATHSAFLGELLSPDGSHLLKDRFLGHFIKVIGYDGALNVKSANVELEKHVGKINLKQKTGGRIDIYISDSQGNSISVENKIYAGDQDAQIERYVNHNKGKNKVYYLNLNGENPSDKSIGKLEEGVDFYSISYRGTIIEWLTNCMKEAAEQPMLRESIRQYILLIKKLTNQLSDNIMEEQVLTTIKNNYTAAKIIADNIWRVELEIVQLFLNELQEYLQAKLDEEYSIKVDSDLTQTWTGLIIAHPDWKGIEIKIEGQSKIPWNDSIYGIRAFKNEFRREDFDTEFDADDLANLGFKTTNNHYWPCYQYILRFSQASEREKLFDPNRRKTLVESTSEKLIELVKLCRVPLSKIHRIGE